MSSPPAPTKPPRGVKQGKETSGLLMSVIRTLSASETNEQREKERAKLEKEYKKSDARLDELVAEHAQEIMDVMQKFTLVTEALSAWGSHGESAASRVAACRGLLRVRRHELQRLWADARTHHYALTMLTDIERVVVAEREAKESVCLGRVLHAAHTLHSALQLARDKLHHVTAIHATTQHLQAKKREVVDVIVNRLLSLVCRSELTELQRTQSERRRAQLLLAELTKSTEVTESYLTDITPEYEASLTEDDNTFETTTAISLEALGVLEQHKEAAEKYKVQLQNELLEIIEQVSRRIIDEGDIELEPETEEDGAMPDEEGVNETARPLARLVNCLTEEFEACGARNKRLIQLWRAALQKHKVSESCLPTELHYWSAVQQVLQLLLTEYLEIESVTLAAARGPRQDAVRDVKLQDFFTKKRPQRRREKLFKLAVLPEWSPVVSVSPRTPRRTAVCPSRPDHLYAVLPALHHLIAHIENITGSECTLRAFLTDYVRGGESERLSAVARARVEAAARAQGANERVTPPHNAVLPQHVVVPNGVLSWCCVSWRALDSIASSARRCGASGGGQAARALHSAIATIATLSVAAHSRLCPMMCRAARWLQDDDIVRFLQSLPNWLALLHPNNKPTQQELNQAYEREAEILGSSLGDGAVSRREIIAEVDTLIQLALLADSMSWLSANISTLPTLLTQPGSGGPLRLPDRFASDVSAAAAIFDDVAHKCLLLLHLEVRIECFHFLGGEERGEGGQETRGGAAQLAQRLVALHDAAPIPYVFNGLGEMMSAAIVWRWQEAGGAAASGRLATLRHCLASLQLPNTGLQRATSYLQLLNCTPEEIIASVKEKGAQFSELEYLNAFKLIGARRGIQPADMRAHLKQLSSALGHVGVTV